MKIKEKTKEQRIEEELQRISIIFMDLEENKKKLAEPLLQNSAFMKVALEDLQKEILEKGVVDTYQNGANQSGTKASVELQAYNSLVKNYNTIQQKLIALAPENPEEDLLQDFWNRMNKKEEQLEEK